MDACRVMGTDAAAETIVSPVDMRVRGQRKMLIDSVEDLSFCPVHADKGHLIRPRKVRGIRGDERQGRGSKSTWKNYYARNNSQYGTRRMTLIATNIQGRRIKERMRGRGGKGHDGESLGYTLERLAVHKGRLTFSSSRDGHWCLST